MLLKIVFIKILKQMNILRNKTLMFVLYHVAEQGVRSYLHYRSASNLGQEQQNHELRKDSISLGRNIVKAVVQSAIFGLDNLPSKR